jgi:4-hydroxy-3-methylbut-2-en-1-yl diphosphate reductase
MLKKIILARHHGFCMGVKRAIKIAEEAAKDSGRKVTILNEIVHNESVVNRFREQGVGQVFSVDSAPQGTLIISAHGVAPDVKQRAEELGLDVIDATCPLVTRIYTIVEKLVADDYYIIHFGDRNHDETTGVVGHAPDRITVVGNKEELFALPDWKERKLGLTVQTTSHQEEYEEMERLAQVKFPHIEIYNTICNATTQRQGAIFELAPQVNAVVVVGSQTSANSKRLAQISQALCGRGFLIDSADDLKDEWFAPEHQIETVGVSAGASTPDFLVEAVLKKLVEISGGTAEVVIPEKKTRIGRIARETEEVH